MSYYVSEEEVEERMIDLARTLLFRSPEGRFTIDYQTRFFYFDQGKVSEEMKAKLRDHVKQNYDDESGTPIEISTELLRKLAGK